MITSCYIHNVMYVFIDSSRLQRAEQELCLLRHTLQGLIVGSGVSWSEDEELLELTMKLGDDHHWR